MADRGPTLRRRELGAALRDLRQGRGMTIEDVAEKLLCSPTKISRIETAQRAASLRDVRDLCGIYEVDDARTDQLMRLSRESRQRGWWQDTDVADKYSTFIGLEAAATTIQHYESAFIPGLLQTERYARAVVRQNSFPEVDDQTAEERVSVRMRRQARLTDDNPLTLWAVIDEMAARRQIGGPDVMAEQLRRLIEASRLRNVTLQVVPSSAGAYVGLEASALQILQFEEQLPDVIYVEGVLGNLFAERSEDVRRISQIFDKLRAEALSPGDTRALIGGIADGLS